MGHPNSPSSSTIPRTPFPWWSMVIIFFAGALPCFSSYMATGQSTPKFSSVAKACSCTVETKVNGAMPPRGARDLSESLSIASYSMSPFMYASLLLGSLRKVSSCALDFPFHATAMYLWHCEHSRPNARENCNVGDSWRFRTIGFGVWSSRWQCLHFLFWPPAPKVELEKSDVSDRGIATPNAARLRDGLVDWQLAASLAASLEATARQCWKRRLPCSARCNGAKAAEV